MPESSARSTASSDVAGAPAPRLAPVGESERIEALDATRGFALVGIFMVNIGAFGEASGYFTGQVPQEHHGIHRIVEVFIETFCEGRFYPLFSMLFGMGLAIQFARAGAARRPFEVFALRRLGVLACIGLLHATLLWYGDILFYYAWAGALMVWLVRFRISTLLSIAGGMFAFACAISIALGVFMVALSGLAPSSATADSMPAAPMSEIDPAGLTTAEEPGVDGAELPVTVFDLFRLDPPSDGPGDPRWIEAETRAYREGSYLTMLGFRIVTWLSVLVFAAFSFFWHILAMMCLGAALLKWRFFSPARARFRRLMIFVGAGAAALSLALASTDQTSSTTLKVTSTATIFILGPLMCLAYLSAITIIVRARVLAPLMALLAATGRMAFTNYLMQTALATTIFYSYGFGLFGTTTHLERLGMVLSIYTCQLFFSVLWLKWFTMGPLEWLWRSATYLRFPPIVRRTERPGRAGPDSATQ